MLTPGARQEAYVEQLEDENGELRERLAAAEAQLAAMGEAAVEHATLSANGALHHYCHVSQATHRREVRRSAWVPVREGE